MNSPFLQSPLRNAPAALLLVSLSACGSLGVDLAADVNTDAESEERSSQGGTTADDSTGRLTSSGGAPGADSGSGGKANSSTGGEGSGGGEGNPTGGSDGSGGSDSDSGPFFFDTFEAEELPETYVTSGVVKRTPFTQYEGDAALEVTQEGFVTVATISHPFPALPSDKLYFRGFILIPEGSLSGLMGLAEFDGPSGEMDLNIYADRTLDVYFHQHNNEVQSEPSAFPMGEWFCLELTTYFHETQGYVDVSVNGTSMARQEGYNTVPEQPYTSIRYGMPWTDGGQTGGKLYWDNVAISDAPLGCD